MSWRCAGKSRGFVTIYSGEEVPDFCEKSADFPYPKRPKRWIRRLCSYGGPFMFLLDYGGLRYLLLLSYNESVTDCIENKLLRYMHDGLEEDDRRRLDEETRKCLRLFWPFLRADCEEQLGKSLCAIGLEKNCEKSCEKRPRNIQLRTVDGALQASEHHVKLGFSDSKPIENPYPQLRCYARHEIVKLKRICRNVFKVRIGGTENCLKELPLGFPYGFKTKPFLRELEILQKLPVHPNLLCLVGVRDAGEGKTDGLVLPYVCGTSLASLSTVTASQKKKWKKEISDALRLLHEKDIVWGDAKPENILIEEKDDNVILVDFGGGFTPGWVDRELRETKEGDLQALSRILDFIEKLS